MKRKHIETYFILLINFVLVEIIFRLLSGNALNSYSCLRIFLGVNIFSIVMSILIGCGTKRLNSIINILLILIDSFYAFLQLGFINFLGVYISIQTSSQLDAVTDYITDFIKSFKGTYFLIFIPLLLAIIYFIVTRKQNKNNRLNVKFLIIMVLYLLLNIFGFYETVNLKYFNEKYQIQTSKDLFMMVDNPSLVVSNYGTFGFLCLDVKAVLLPSNYEKEIETEVVINEQEEITDNSRVIDDTKWRELIDSEKNSTMNSLNNYFINRTITDKNDFTGLFEDKNLIVIMMESVNDIFINEDYYPNFYKILNEGWYWENNYSPRNSCATMNNEFSGMTSLYSIYNTCTASKYKNNTYQESIFNLFNKKGYTTFSAHNYTEAYYPRSKIHTNLYSGEYYGVKKLGISYSSEYKNWSNDDDFLKEVLNIIDNKTQDGNHFMTWLTTVSSHQPYSYSSIQGDKYYDMTKNSGYPSDVRRYMSKLKILDDGLGILLNGLEERGILDDTVIVLYGDHYPYGIKTQNINKVIDYDSSIYMNMERVPFVIYNSKTISKVYSDYTSYINIVPTISNLFNLDYDPRLYLGDDLLNPNYKSLVAFADGSWKNEIAYYNASKNKIDYFTEQEYTQEEILNINETINNKINISSQVIKNNYFEYLYKSLDK